jgi:hypothetical protein
MEFVNMCHYCFFCRLIDMEGVLCNLWSGAIRHGVVWSVGVRHVRVIEPLGSFGFLEVFSFVDM